MHLHDASTLKFISDCYIYFSKMLYWCLSILIRTFLCRKKYMRLIIIESDKNSLFAERSIEKLSLCVKHKMPA